MIFLKDFVYTYSISDRTNRKLVTYYCALPPGFHEEPDGTGDRLKGSNEFKRIETKNGDDFFLDGYKPNSIGWVFFSFFDTLAQRNSKYHLLKRNGKQHREANYRIYDMAHYDSSSSVYWSLWSLPGQHTGTLSAIVYCLTLTKERSRTKYLSSGIRSNIFSRSSSHWWRGERSGATSLIRVVRDYY